MVNADRLGYDVYAAIEHVFFPKFSASANVFGLFRMALARTSRIRFRPRQVLGRRAEPRCPLQREPLSRHPRGISDRTYDLAAQNGRGVVVPPLLSCSAPKNELDLCRSKCQEYGTSPNIAWIHACYRDEDRAVARQEVERHMRGFLEGNASPLTDHPPLPADRLDAAGYGFYCSEDHGAAGGDALGRDDRRRGPRGRAGVEATRGPPPAVLPDVVSRLGLEGAVIRARKSGRLDSSTLAGSRRARGLRPARWSI